MRITLFVPCYIQAIYPRTGMNMVRILEKLGHEVEFPGELTCCGQPPFNSGYWDEARKIARPVLGRLAGAEAVVIGSGSCGAMLKVFYPELFHGQPEDNEARSLAERCWEFSDFLVTKLGVGDLGAEFPFRATFHDGCHGLRELKTKAQPRELLKHVRGLDLVEMSDAETCCGFGGTFATKYASISTAMGEVKCASAAETQADYIISNDSSCLMHLQGTLQRQGRPLKTIHLADVLATFPSA